MNDNVQSDLIRRPPHYVSKAGTEAIEVIERYGLAESFHLASSMKYLLRAGKKGEAKQCLEKCRWYMHRWDKADYPVPSADEGALEWKTPEQIVEDFGLVDTARGNVVQAILTMCAYDVNYAEEWDLAMVEIDAAIEEAA